MYFKRDGLPEESDIVLCTVTKIHYHSVFVSLNEYSGRSAILHISEIAPGRIRNINEYVKEGKVIVCKILKVDEKKGHIDVSLRRVTESQRRTKQEILKQEQKAEKIIEFVAKKEKKKTEDLVKKITTAILGKYETIYEAFTEIVAGKSDISELKLDAKTEKALQETISQRIAPKSIEITAKLKLESHASNGLEIIKDILTKCKIDESVQIRYLGAGTYNLHIESKEYEEAEDTIERIEGVLKAVPIKECSHMLQRI
jgi:translation initiation factor 2 subunit 1